MKVYEYVKCVCEASDERWRDTAILAAIWIAMIYSGQCLRYQQLLSLILLAHFSAAICNKTILLSSNPNVIHFLTSFFSVSHIHIISRTLSLSNLSLKMQQMKLDFFNKFSIMTLSYSWTFNRHSTARNTTTKRNDAHIFFSLSH